MKFFKPEDFALPPSNEFGTLSHSLFSMAEVANAKLEANKIELRFGYEGGIYDPKLGCTPMKSFGEYCGYFVKIGETPKCEHPKERVKRKPYEPGYLGLYDFQCECGVKVKPISFEES